MGPIGDFDSNYNLQYASFVVAIIGYYSCKLKHINADTYRNYSERVEGICLTWSLYLLVKSLYQTRGTSASLSGDNMPLVASHICEHINLNIQAAHYYRIAPNVSINYAYSGRETSFRTLSGYNYYFIEELYGPAVNKYINKIEVKERLIVERSKDAEIETGKVLQVKNVNKIDFFIVKNHYRAYFKPFNLPTHCKIQKEYNFLERAQTELHHVFFSIRLTPTQKPTAIIKRLWDRTEIEEQFDTIVVEKALLDLSGYHINSESEFIGDKNLTFDIISRLTFCRYSYYATVKYSYDNQLNNKQILSTVKQDLWIVLYISSSVARETFYAVCISSPKYQSEFYSIFSAKELSIGEIISFLKLAVSDPRVNVISKLEREEQGEGGLKYTVIL